MTRSVFHCLTLAVACFVWLGVSGATASTFYVDPANGSPAGDGSQANPWRTLQGVFSNSRIESQTPAVFPYNGTLTALNPGAPVKAGDTLKLLSGYHGDIFERSYFNADNITIEAAAGHTPTLKGFHIQGAKNWTLRGLSISPEHAGVADTDSIVRFETHNWQGPATDITLENLTVFSASDTSAWTAADWNANAAHGIRVSGPNSASANFVIRNNNITNVDFGINTKGSDILADHNTIENFSGDGMRGGGDRVTFSNNTIKTSYDVNGNHDDAIQFFQGFGVASHDVVLSGNRIETFADPTRPLTHGAQGIGNFNGPYIDWVVENNVVMTAHHHGITISDAQNARVVNNTVLDISDEFRSWISLEGSTNSTVRNNLSQKLLIGGSTGLASDHNLIINTTNRNALFEDWANGDLHLKTGSLAIDSGDGLLAPATDIDGNPRPSGTGFDIGAYEFVFLTAGDFNASGQVEQGDLDLVLQNWGDDTHVTGIPAGWTNDHTNLGQIEQAELDRVLQNWGSTSAPDFRGANVPEPGALSLAAMFAVLRRRRACARRVHSGRIFSSNPLFLGTLNERITDGGSEKCSGVFFVCRGACFVCPCPRG